jgi:hypothetical protein
MYQHSNTTRAFQSTASAQLPQAVSRDARHNTVTSEMGFHNDDDIGFPTGVQEGGHLAEKGAATVPE